MILFCNIFSIIYIPLAGNTNGELTVVYIKDEDQDDEASYRYLERAVTKLHGFYITKLNQTSTLLPNALISIPVTNAKELLSQS